MAGRVETHISEALDALICSEEESASILCFTDGLDVKHSGREWLQSHLVTLLSALLREPANKQPSAVDKLVEACDRLPAAERLVDMTTKKMRLLLRRPYFPALGAVSYALAVRERRLPRPDEFAISHSTSNVTGPKVYGGRTKAPDPRLKDYLDPFHVRSLRVDTNATGTSHQVVVWALTRGGDHTQFVPVTSFFSLAGTNLDPRDRHSKALTAEPERVTDAARATAGFPAGFDFRFTFAAQVRALSGRLALAARAADHDPFAEKWCLAQPLGYPSDELRDAANATRRTLYPGDDLEAMSALEDIQLRPVARSFLFGRHASSAQPVVDPPRIWLGATPVGDDEEAFASGSWEEISEMRPMRAVTGKHGSSPAAGVVATALARVSLAGPMAWRTVPPCDSRKDLVEAARACKRSADDEAALADLGRELPTIAGKENGPDREMLAACAVLRGQLTAMPEWTA